MPTIDIPDKICPHCGGTKYYIRYKNGKLHSKTCHTKMIATKKRNPEDPVKKAIRRHKYYLDNKESSKLKSVKWQKENIDRYKIISNRAVAKYQSSKKGELMLYKYEKTKRLILADDYIIRLIIDDTDLKFSDVTPELIELKRKQLLLHRQLKSNKWQVKQ